MSYQPKTGQKCHCKPGVHRDNCPDCEGTGQRIDFAAIRNRKLEPIPAVSEYGQQAQSFLDQFQIKFRATLSDSKVAPWGTNEKVSTNPRHHYRVTLSRHGISRCGSSNYQSHDNGGRLSLVGPSRLTFDFWSSVHDAKAGIKTVTPYDVLACIGSDASCPDSFKDFCSEFGYEQDSIKAQQTFRRCSAFARRLQAFFSKDELEALQEIN